MSDPEARATARRRVLLAEDDPVSASFLGEALRGLGLEVCVCDRGREALRLARSEHFDLLLLDCRLPGMGAQGILEALREGPDAASRDAHVLATSAEVTPALERDLRALGCRALLRKPLRLAELEREVRRHAHIPAERLVDDAAGLEASGSPDNLRALRALFAGELDALAGELACLLGEREALRERLHRLRASCGFCGALALGSACATLGDALDADRETRDRAVARFESILGDTLRLLRAAGRANPP